MADDFEYVAKLNIEDILSGVTKVDKATEDMAKNLDASFKKAGKSINGLFIDSQGRIREANGRFSKMGETIRKTGEEGERAGQKTGQSFQTSGVQIGVISGVVSALATEFIRLGEQAISALIDIGRQSVETAIQIDTLKARLGGIFDGSKEAADEAFTFIQDKSQGLGIDLSELAGAFLPKTESLDQFERVAKIATALARSDPEQGAIGARIALIEALSGTFTSLQRRFEIPKSDIENIKEAFDKEGIEGFLKALETTLAASGKSFDDLANTAQTSFSKLQIGSEQILGRLGVPIVESLEQASSKILDFINANEDELIVFADTIGRAIADAIDLISSIDLGQLDVQGLIEFADYIQRIIEAAKLLTGQLSGSGGIITGLRDVSIAAAGGIDIFDLLYRVFTQIDDAFVTAAKGAALLRAGYAGLTASMEPLLGALGSLLEALARAAAFDYTGAVESLGEGIAAIQNSEEAQKAFNDSLTDSLSAFDEYNKSIEGNKDSQQSLREELEKQKAAGTDAADAILGAAQAQRELEEAGTAAAEAQAKINEAMAKAELDHQRALEDAEIDYQRKLTDIAVEFAQKREDAARDNLQKLADIQDDYQEDVSDAALDLSREEEDIARKFGQDRIDLETENRQKILDVETEYRQKLEDIQTQFNLDADEAEQKRDAVSFLKAVKEKNEAIAQAETDRQRQISEQQVTNAQKLEDQRLAQERELEEARIANERKLEDLRTNLNRQIEEQNTAYARQLEDLAINEARKNEEAAVARERDIEDAKLAYERKLEDLKASLEAEYALIQEYNALLEAEALRHAEAMAAANALASEAGASAGGITPGITGGGDRGPGGSNIPNKPLRDIPGFAEGGTVPGPMGQPRLVVAHGGETITPPGQPVLMPTFGGGMGGSVTNSRQTNVNLPLATPEQILSPFLMAQIRNMMVRTLGDVDG